MNNWFSPMEKPQLLPKHLAEQARKFSKDEAEAAILNAIKNHRASIYSHYTSSTISSPWTTTIGTTTIGATSGTIQALPIGMTTHTVFPMATAYAGNPINAYSTWTL